MKIIIANSRKHGSKEVLVDDGDYDYLKQFNWTVCTTKKSRTFYALRAIRKIIDGKSVKRTIRIHTVIMNTPAGYEVDHIDHNGLNCQRSNMRITTHAKNLQNTISQRGATSSFLGVCWDKNRNKWFAKIKIDQVTINLGRFDDEKEAAKKYDEAALKHYGEFANLNFK